MKEIITKAKKNDVLILTIVSGLIGAIIFVLIYGIECINVTKDAWLYNQGDLTQHYLGWIFYRKSRLEFSNWNI